MGIIHKQLTVNRRSTHNPNNFKMMNLAKAFQTVAKALSAHGIWGFGDIGREEEFRINGGSS